MKRTYRQHRAGKFTDQLRQRVQERLGVCPTCGGATNGSVRASHSAARRLKIGYSTLTRFVNGGDPSAPLIDKLEGWLAHGAKE